LIDCGEGTQMQLAKYRIKIQRIGHILISHLHGDHYLGLMGLLSTMNLYGRNKPLYLYGPQGLMEILTMQLKYSQTFLRYKVHFREIDASMPELIFEGKNIIITTIPLRHRIKCAGFLFREKEKPKRLDKEKIQDIPLEKRAALKAGEDVRINGRVIKNEEVTLEPKKPRSFAYCSDTIYDEGIVSQIKNVDLLYHEATFLSDKSERAKLTFHSTAAQAAIIARNAQVEELLIGHYSTRYKDLNPLLKEARDIFPNTKLAIEGETILITN